MTRRKKHQNTQKTATVFNVHPDLPQPYNNANQLNGASDTSFIDGCTDFYSLATDPKCLWRYIMALILERHHHSIDTEISQQLDSLEHVHNSQSVTNLLLELGRLQRSVAQNVKRLEDKKKIAKELFLDNLKLLSAGYEVLPIIDGCTTMDELEKMVDDYSSSDSHVDEESADWTDAEYCENTVASSGKNGAGYLPASDDTTHCLGDDVSDANYVVGLLQPIDVDMPASDSSNKSPSLTMPGQNPPQFAFSVMENDPAIVSFTPKESTSSDGSAADQVSEVAGLDGDEWETVMKRKSKVTVSQAPQQTTPNDRVKEGLLSKQKTSMCRLFMEGRCKWGLNCNYAHSEAELTRKPHQSKANVVIEDPTPAGNIKFKEGHQRRKTEMCKNFELGRCNWGESCNYAHNSEELKAALNCPINGLLHSQSNTAYNTIQKMENPTPSGNRKFKGVNGDLRRKTEMCENFRLGRCSWGQQCNYAHSADELKGCTINGSDNFRQDNSNLTIPTVQTALNSTIGKKLLMCIGYSEGKCKMPADVCKYAHDPSELDPRFDHNEPCTNQQCAGRLRYERRKTTLCSAENSSCKFGSTCTYAHSESELRPLPKHEMCRRHAAGHCTSAEICVYAHSRLELRAKSPSPLE